MAPGTLINVNFPGAPAGRREGHPRLPPGHSATMAACRIVERTDPRGYDYYWFGLGADGRDAGPFDRPRSDRRRLCLGHARSTST